MTLRLNTTPQNNWALPACHPCKLAVPFFDGAGSYGHAAIGAASTLLPPALQAAVALGFLFYQMSETESLEAKVGDFGEFAAGYLAASALQEAA